MIVLVPLSTFVMLGCCIFGPIIAAVLVAGLVGIVGDIFAAIGPWMFRVAILLIALSVVLVWFQKTRLWAKGLLRAGLIVLLALIIGEMIGGRVPPETLVAIALPLLLLAGILHCWTHARSRGDRNYLAEELWVWGLLLPLAAIVIFVLRGITNWVDSA